MAKLIILSVVLVSFIAPIWVSTSAKPRQTLRRLQWAMVGFIFLWGYLCTHVYPAIVPIE